MYLKSDIAYLSALVVYEYAITLRQEIETVWRRRFSLLSLLLITSRWSLLLYVALGAAPAYPKVSAIYFSVQSGDANVTIRLTRGTVSIEPVQEQF